MRFHHQNHHQKVSRFIAALALAGAATAPAAFAAPAAPSTPDLQTASDSGFSQIDNLTNISKPVFQGTGKPLTVINLFAGQLPVGVGVVNPYGKWAIISNTALSNGVWNITTKTTQLGVQSAASPALKVTVDTVSSPVTRPTLWFGDDSGVSKTDNITNVTSPKMHGTGTPGDTIRLYIPVGGGFVETTVGKATVASNGQWLATTSFGPNSGTRVVRAESTDPAGNKESSSGALSLQIDTVAPAAPSAPDLVAAFDSGASNSDDKTNLTKLQFTSKGEPLGTISLTAISNSTVVLGEKVADASGLATVTPVPFMEGYYNMVAEISDRAGNKSPQSAPTLIHVKTTPPQSADKPRLTQGSDSGTKGDNITNASAPFVQGLFADPEEKTTLHFFAGIFHYEATATARGGYSWTAGAPTLPQGVYAVTAKTTDVHGNSSVSDALQLTIDTTAPTAPSAPDLAPHRDLGASNSDNITHEGYITLYGKSEPFTWAKIYKNSVFLTDAFADGFGKWETKTQLQAGPFSLTAAVSDTAGNFSALSLPLDVLIDTTLPNAYLTIPAAGFPNNLASLTGTATDPIQNRSGVYKVTMTIRRSDNMNWNGTKWIPASAGQGAYTIPTTYANGKWSKTTGLPPAMSGIYAITLYAHDVAGNQSFYKTYLITAGPSAAPALDSFNPSANYS